MCELVVWVSELIFGMSDLICWLSELIFCVLDLYLTILWLSGRAGGRTNGPARLQAGRPAEGRTDRRADGEWF